MTKDYQLGFGVSSALINFTAANTNVLSGGISSYKPLELGADFSHIFGTLDVGTSSVVADLMKDLKIGAMAPSWQQGMSAVKPGWALATIGDLKSYVSTFNSMLAPKSAVDLGMADALMFSSAIRETSTSVTESLLGNIRTATIVDFLDQAEAFRSEIDDEELEELTDEFFLQQPDLATAIDDLSILITLSRAQRLAIIWFVRVAVTLYVAGHLLNLSHENPEFLTLLSVFGVGAGTVAGKIAGTATGIVLDHVPSTE